MTAEIWTIEINQDADFAAASSWHIDPFSTTSARNLRIACHGNQTSRWAIVGLANSLSEAKDKAERIRLTLCEMHEKKDGNERRTV